MQPTMTHDDGDMIRRRYNNATDDGGVVVLIAIMAPLMELQHLSPHMISTCIVE
jgi:hypothetical protein